MPMEWSLLLWNFVAVMGFMTAVWALSVVIKNASIADTFWGLGFVLAAWITFLGAEGYLGRRLLITLLVTAWGLRLALHIGIRSWDKGEDRRYQAWRRQYGERFWWVSLFTVFLLQGMLLWVIPWSPKWASGPRGRTGSSGSTGRVLFFGRSGSFLKRWGTTNWPSLRRIRPTRGKRWLRASGATRGTPITSGNASCGGASSLSLWPRPVLSGRLSAL